MPEPESALVELRVLEGPNLYFPRAAIKLTLDVTALAQAPEADLRRLAEALNFHLKPAPVAVLVAARVPDDLHARFSAVERRYLFRLQARRAPATHDRGLVWQVLHPLDADAMRKGAAHLRGRHDFTTFRSSIWTIGYVTQVES